MYTIEMDNFNVAFTQKHLAAFVAERHQTQREVEQRVVVAADEDYLNCHRTEVSLVNIPELWNLLKHQIQIPGPQHPNPIHHQITRVPNPEYEIRRFFLGTTKLVPARTRGSPRKRYTRRDRGVLSLLGVEIRWRAKMTLYTADSCDKIR